MYDPHARLKRNYRAALTVAINALGVQQLPLFAEQRVKVTVDFYVTNLRKDVDNMLKFTLDILQGIAFSNDCNVFSVVANKRACPGGDQRSEIIVEMFNI